MTNQAAGRPMTPEEIAELRRLHAAATPGPWAVWYVDREDKRAGEPFPRSSPPPKRTRPFAPAWPSLRAKVPKAIGTGRSLKATGVRFGNPPTGDRFLPRPPSPPPPTTVTRPCATHGSAETTRLRSSTRRSTRSARSAWTRSRTEATSTACRPPTKSRHDPEGPATGPLLLWYSKSIRETES